MVRKPLKDKVTQQRAVTAPRTTVHTGFYRMCLSPVLAKAELATFNDTDPDLKSGEHTLDPNAVGRLFCTSVASNQIGITVFNQMTKKVKNNS